MALTKNPERKLPLDIKQETPTVEKAGPRTSRAPLSRPYAWLWVVAAGVALLVYLALALVKIPLVQNYRADQIDTIVVDEQNRGFHAPQVDGEGRLYRWSDAKSHTLFNFTSRKPLKITVWVRSAAVAGGPDKPVFVYANDVKIGEMQPDPHKLDFTPFTLSFVPPATDKTQLKIGFEATTFQAPGDPRPLGFQIQALTIDRSESWQPVSSRYWLLYLLLPLALLSAGLWYASRRLAGSMGKLSGYAAVLPGFAGAGFMLVTLGLLSRIGVIDQTIYWLWVVGCFYLFCFFTAASFALLPWGEAGGPSIYRRLYLRFEPFVLKHPYLSAFAALAVANLALTAVLYLKVFFETGNISWFARYWDGPEYTFIAHGIYDPQDPLLRIPDFARHSRAYWTAHFPLFPLILRLFAPLVGFSYAPMLADLIISTLFAWVLYRLLRDFNYTASPLWLSLVALVLPPRWLLNHNIGASEPTLLLCTITSFYCFKRKWYWRAGIAGAFAAFARPPGIFLFAGYLAFLGWEALQPMLEERKFSLRSALRRFNWKAALSLCLIPLGTVAAFTIFWWRYGDFLVYFKVPEGVLKSALPFTVFLYDDRGNTGNFFYFLLEAIGLIILWRQRRYDVFWVGLATTLYVIFLVHPDLMRYSLPAFPFLLLIPFAPYLTGKYARWFALPVLIVMLMYSWSVLPTGIAFPDTWNLLRQLAP